jgi:hypothetical protein
LSEPVVALNAALDVTARALILARDDIAAEAASPTEAPGVSAEPAPVSAPAGASRREVKRATVFKTEITAGHLDGKRQVAADRVRARPQGPGPKRPQA